jgi:hypothetical protein
VSTQEEFEEFPGAWERIGERSAAVDLFEFDGVLSTVCSMRQSLLVPSLCFRLAVQSTIDSFGLVIVNTVDFTSLLANQQLLVSTKIFFSAQWRDMRNAVPFGHSRLHRGYKFYDRPPPKYWFKQVTTKGCQPKGQPFTFANNHAHQANNENE